MPKLASRHQVKSKVASRNRKKNAKNAKKATPRSAGAKHVSSRAAATPAINVVRRTALKNQIQQASSLIRCFKNTPGGRKFDSACFEQRCDEATSAASAYLRQRIGFPLPVLGTLTCSLVGFENDLDGHRLQVSKQGFPIKLRALHVLPPMKRRNTACFIGIVPNSIVKADWRFCDPRSGIDVTCHVARRCADVYYKRKMLKPPFHIRVAAVVALAHHCLPSKAAGHPFLRAASGCLPGGVCAKRIVAIGMPKPMTCLPLFVEDPMGVEASLVLLAEVSPTRFLACPGALKKAPDCNPERSSLFYKEGIRLVNLNKHQRYILEAPSCAPASLSQANSKRPALKLITALALCMKEIYDAEKHQRQPDFKSFIETRVDHWPHEYVTGKRLIIVWADEDDRMYAVSSPILAQLLRFCSGAISPAPSAPAAPAGPEWK